MRSGCKPAINKIKLTGWFKARYVINNFTARVTGTVSYAGNNTPDNPPLFTFAPKNVLIYALFLMSNRVVLCFN